MAFWTEPKRKCISRTTRYCIAKEEREKAISLGETYSRELSADITDVNIESDVPQMFRIASKMIFRHLTIIHLIPLSSAPQIL